MIKKICLITICFFLFGFIASCDKAENPSGPETTNEPSNENILRIDTFGAFPSLNPQDDNLGSSGDIFPLLYSFLCVPDETGELKPDLAVSWTYDPQIFVWTIVLRANAVFHDNQPVTSKDVAYSLLFSLKNINESLMDLVREITPVSDTRLYIYLKKDDPGFMEKIWDQAIYPRPVNSGTKDPEQASHPVGSGPFQFVSKSGDEKVVLKANKNYYLGPPSIDRVEFYYQPDREKSWTRLLAGQTDIAFEITPKNYEIMKQYEDQFYFDHYTMHRYTILLYNTHDPLFSDPLVRQALTHAIDRDYIVKHMLRGSGKAASGPMGINSPYHNPNVVPLSYNPQKSLELLHQAGWAFDNKGHFLYKDNKLFKFTLSVIKEFQVEQAIARYIKLCFNDIGIQMTIDLVPYDRIGEKYNQNTDFQAVLTEFNDGHRCPEWLKEIWTPNYSGKSIAGCFAQPGVTNLLEQAFSTTDSAQKTKCLHQADALIASLQPGTFLYHKTAIDVMSKRFFLPAPFELTTQGIYRLKDAVLRKY
jgi:peptide/nickel transport system substrate-binding protein